jgi:hypothetical protein
MKVIYGSSLPIEDDSDLHGHRQPAMFRESLARFGIPAENVTLGLPPSNSREWVLDIFRRILSPLPADEIVLLTDAWDVFFCTGLEEIERTYLAFQKPIVFSMETNLFPPEVARFGAVPRPLGRCTRWRYINGGQMMGRAGDLLALHEEPDFWVDGVCNNQEALNRWWIRHPRCENFATDTCCLLFCALYDNGHMHPRVGTALEVRADQRQHAVPSWRRVRNRETESWPCTIHGNGGFAEHAMSLWRKMR